MLSHRDTPGYPYAWDDIDIHEHLATSKLFQNKSSQTRGPTPAGLLQMIKSDLGHHWVPPCCVREQRALGTRRHLLYPRILKQPLCLAEQVIDVIDFSGVMNTTRMQH